jgi:hypothetical protein
MVKCSVLSDVRDEFLSTTYSSFGFKGLNTTILMKMMFFCVLVPCRLAGKSIATSTLKM